MEKLNATKKIMKELINCKNEILWEIEYNKSTNEKTPTEVIKEYVGDIICDIEMNCIKEMNFNFLYTETDIDNITLWYNRTQI